MVTISNREDLGTAARLRPRESRDRHSCHARSITRAGTEIFAACGPRLETPVPGSADSQLRECYEALGKVLDAAGATPSHVVSERIHFGDVLLSPGTLQEVRGEFYGPADRYPQPASSVLRQPPSRPGQVVALQAQVMIPRSGLRLKDRWEVPRNGHGSVRIRHEGEARWIHVGDCVSESHIMDQVEDPPSFETQADDMFGTSRGILERHGAGFLDVVRTWIFVKDIDRDYSGLNNARGRFFKSQGVTRWPASTGIQGHPYPTQLLCSMDLLALQGPPSLQAAPMRASTLNEAPVYGSLFSRGMRVAVDGRIYLFISGTASIDDAGRIVHEGDHANQTRKMFSNIQNLLEAQGATMADLVTLTSYLKDREFHHEFERLAHESGVGPDVPNTITAAGVCRPGWLVEVEGLAVIDSTRSARKP